MEAGGQSCFFFDQAARSGHRIRSFLSMAARFGDVDSLRKLLQDAIAGDSRFMTSPIVGLVLKRATQAGQVGILRCMVEAGADINTTFKGASALHEAVKGDNLGVLQFLLTVPSVRRESLSLAHKTPVMEAACGGRVRCLAALLTAGCQAGTKNPQGMTALHYCLLPCRGNLDSDEDTDSEDTTACMDLLLAAGADIDAQDRFGSTPLHIAVATDNLEAVRWLLFRNCHTELEARAPDFPHPPGTLSGAEQNAAMTPLTLGVHLSRRPLVETLVACGARVPPLGRTLMALCPPHPHPPLPPSLLHALTHPPSLQRLCRTALRHALPGHDLRGKVATLRCVPGSVRRYILLTDELQRG